MTSARAARVLDIAPIAVIRPPSTRIASASSLGAPSIPVATIPMFTKPKVATTPPQIAEARTTFARVNRRGAGRVGVVGVEGTRSLQAAADEARPDGAQPLRGSARVPRGPLGPSRAR